MREGVGIKTSLFFERKKKNYDQHPTKQRLLPSFHYGKKNRVMKRKASKFSAQGVFNLEIQILFKVVLI